MIDLIKEYKKTIVAATAISFYQDMIVEAYVQSIEFPKIKDLKEGFDEKNEQRAKSI